MDWIISANASLYDHSSSFEHYGFIDWRQGNTNYQIGDLVYIYCTRPIQKIRYKCRIDAINLDFKMIRDDKEYWFNESEYLKSLDGKFKRLNLVEQIDTKKLNLSNLITNGLNAPPQGPVKLSEKLSDYISSNFNDTNLNEIFPDTIDEIIDAYEGLKKQVIVNKYERSSIARVKCIEHHGSRCKVCDINFGDIYGDIGEDFIHVHHLIPIHNIGKEYKIDYIKDLIPVCPNCHSMLHRRNPPLAIEELKEKIKVGHSKIPMLSSGTSLTQKF